MDIKITPNKIIAFYFAIPITLGMLLSNVLGLDISRFMKEYFGVFRFLDAAGKDIQAKSMILLIALIFSPLAWVYLSRLKYSDKAKKARHDMSAKKVFFAIVIGGAVLGPMALYMAFINEPSIYSLQKSLRATRFLLGATAHDLSFGLFAPTVIITSMAGFAGVPLGIKELFIKFNNRNNYNS